MTPSAGEIWRADVGGEERHLVAVLSDRRFHAIAGRAVVVPVLDHAPEVLYPWHVEVPGGSVLGVQLVSSISADRLLERVEVVPPDVLLRARRVVGMIVG